MSKSITLISIFLIIFMLFVPVFVQATDVNMNLTSDNSTSTTNTTGETDSLAPQGTSYGSNSPTINALNDLPESELGLTNILNIILIVVGVLLILLAVAIMIRLKK